MPNSVQTELTDTVWFFYIVCSVGDNVHNPNNKSASSYSSCRAVSAACPYCSSCSYLATPPSTLIVNTPSGPVEQSTLELELPHPNSRRSSPAPNSTAALFTATTLHPKIH